MKKAIAIITSLALILTTMFICAPTAQAAGADEWALAKTLPAARTFLKTCGVAVDSDGGVYVADYISGNQGRVLKFKDNGTLDTTWGDDGHGAHPGIIGTNTYGGLLFAPDCLAVDSSKKLYASDFVTNRVYRFKADGTLDGTYCGTGYLTISGPSYLAVDSHDELYVTSNMTTIH